MKKYFLFVSIILFTCKSYSQINALGEYVNKGIELHDQGKYDAAITQYKKALEVDKTSPLANYEIASTYFALGDYEKAIEHSNVVIKEKDKFVSQAYLIKGSSEDLLGKHKEAIKTYKEAIKKNPDENLLYYNLGLTYYNQKENKEAEEALQKSVLIKSSHASSHLLLGYLMNSQGKRVQSLLALYNFLLLEPQSKRAKSSYKLLESQTKKGVRKENPKSTTITISDSQNKDEFSAAEMMISLLEASKGVETNANKTEYELFATNTDAFFSILGELKNKNKGFWWIYYVSFFSDLSAAKHTEAFSYYISQSKDDENINAWLKANQQKVDELLKWVADYGQRK